MTLDTLLINGVIYTMEKDGQKVEAIGIKNGIIEFCGSNEKAKEYSYEKLIDLNGQTVLPGMADSHMHMYAFCQNRTLVNLQGVNSIDEMIDRLKEKANITPPGNWIKGVNFDQTQYVENRFPTKEDLDKISVEHPIVIKRCCLHTVVANSKALEVAGVKKGFIGGSGGIIEVDKNGQPNGILREQSTRIFDNIIPDSLSNEEEKIKIIKEVLKEMSSKGITTIHTYAAKIWRYEEDIELYKKLAEENELPLRVTVCLDELFDIETISVEGMNNPYRIVQQGAYKLFTDGSLGSRSAALKEPYSDDTENKGFLVCTQEELNEKVLIAYRKGLQPAIHAIGDAALDITLTSIENCLEKTRVEGMTEAEQNSRLPFRIIHVQMIDEGLLNRMKKLPLVLDIQPGFLCTDLIWIEDRIGKERMKNSYCWKKLQNEGLIQTGGSDCPVEYFDPFMGIYGAATRSSLDGNPVAGFYPEEKLSVYQAISLYTKNVHYATGQEKVLGTLTKGKFADLVVLDRDPFSLKEEDLLKVQIVNTYLAGEKVY